MKSTQKTITAFLLLATLVFAVYSNTFKASWQLDDWANITHHKAVQISDLSPDSLWKAIQFNDRVHRPVARLSIALNHYVGGLNVTGYHLVNITIHLITAFFLFLSLLLLFRTPVLHEKYANSAYFIALLSAVLWAVNPVQTQAVTYIVQRMAAMAAMFFIIAVYFYLKARMADNTKQKVWFFFACFISFLLGVGSKENAAMLPVVLVVIELIFFQPRISPKVRLRAFMIGGGAFLAVLACGYIFLEGNLFSFLDYGRRYFTLSERILTEPRIVVFYLSLLFYPVPTRLSLEHFFPVSTSVFSPWTTWASILLIICLIAVGVYYRRKYPLLSFAILFFFLNHLIESTVIPLELVFEHRNYLPSLFLFVPVAAGLKYLIDFYRKKNEKTMYSVLAGFVVLLVIGLSTGTYIRNMAWHTTKILMEDIIKKEPQSGRAYHNLAYGYYEKVGQFDRALEMYQKSAKLPQHSKDAAPMSLNNIGSIYHKKKEYRKAQKYWGKALNVWPGQERVRLNLVGLYAKKLNKLTKAKQCLFPLLMGYPGNPELLNLKGYILLKKGKMKKAMGYFQASFRQGSFNESLLKNTGKIHAVMKNYPIAELYMKEAYKRSPRDINTVLWLVFINMVQNDSEDMNRFTKLVTCKANFGKIQSGIETLAFNNIMPKKGRKRLVAHLANKLNHQIETILHQDQ